MEILRDHGPKSDFRPDKYGGTVCMHAADKMIRRSQSVGSLVTRLSSGGAGVYVTGAANPCLSPFYPVSGAGTVNPTGYLEGGAEFNEEVYWWECERLHRKAMWHYPEALADIQPKIRGYEQEMLKSAEGAGAALNQAAVNGYFGKARSIVREWGAKLDGMPETKPGWLFQRYWQGYNKLNGIE
jgi:dipeptidase